MLIRDPIALGPIRWMGAFVPWHRVDYGVADRRSPLGSRSLWCGSRAMQHKRGIGAPGVPQCLDHTFSTAARPVHGTEGVWTEVIWGPAVS